MKKLFAAALAGSAALMLNTAAARADSYQGAASYDGLAWRITWTGTHVGCTLSDLSPIVTQPTVATVDGNPTSLVISITSLLSSDLKFDYNPSPPGTLSKITINGLSSFDCGGHTYLLPGYVAPPAPAAIPTLSEWAMILLGVALAGGAALTIQRRRQAAGSPLWFRPK